MIDGVHNIDPEKYIKLFNIKESLFFNYYEIEERKRLELDGIPNIEAIYVKGQQYLNKDDLENFNFSRKRDKEIFNLIIRRGELFVDFAGSLSNSFSDKNWEELIIIYKDLMKYFGEFIRVVDVVVYILHNFEKTSTKKFTDKGFSESDYDTLTHPLYNTYHQRRKKDIINLKLNRISREELVKKWEWSNMDLFHYNAFDDKFIDEQTKSIKYPEKELEIIKQNHIKAKNEFYQIYSKLPDDLKELADHIQRFIEVRDYRFELAIKGIFYCLPFLRELADRLKITYNELIYMKPDEVISEIIPADLGQRMQGYANIKNNILVGREADEIYNLFNKKLNLTEVRGKGVSKGKITGKAKIVITKDDLHKIEENDIIVCDITTPDYMSALHKVSAIVANIGGFTSHSAIVSREFGIPCVVGVGNATNVFEDNDTIEVDADKGIVRKIE